MEIYTALPEFAIIKISSLSMRMTERLWILITSLLRPEALCALDYDLPSPAIAGYAKAGKLEASRNDSGVG
jgi:hypothetical protein